MTLRGPKVKDYYKVARENRTFSLDGLGTELYDCYWIKTSNNPPPVKVNMQALYLHDFSRRRHAHVMLMWSYRDVSRFCLFASGKELSSSKINNKINWNQWTSVKTSHIIKNTNRKAKNTNQTNRVCKRKFKKRIFKLLHSMKFWLRVKMDEHFYTHLSYL